MGIKVGQHLAAIRKDRGISEFELAEALQVRVVKYRTLEENISEPDLELLVQLAEFYGIGLDDLLRRSPAAEPDLKHILETRPLYDGQRLSAQDVRILEETAGKLARQTRKLEELARLIEEEPELVRRLQELKILGSRLDNKIIAETLEKALA